MAHEHDSDTQNPVEEDSGDSSSHPVETQEVEKGIKEFVVVVDGGALLDDKTEILISETQESRFSEEMKMGTNNPSESYGYIGFSEEKGEMGESKPQEIEAIDGEGKRAASGIGQSVAGNDGVSVSESDGEKTVKCPLRIEVIDDTALIETESRAMKEKRPKRQVKAGKGKNSRVDERMVKNEGKNDNNGKRVYSKEELMGLRYEGLDGQKRRWIAVYCGLGPWIQKEYDGLVDCGARPKQPQQRKKKNEKMNTALNVNQDSQNEASISFLGKESSQATDYEDRNIKAIDPSSGLLPVDDEISCSIPQGEYMEDDDSDEDYAGIMKPAFVVMGEPDFNSGPPEDGLEYLRRVRWEAGQVPKVKVAQIDSSKMKKQPTVYMPQIPDIPKCPAHLLPLKEWENAFLSDFSQLRLSLSYVVVPERNDSVGMESLSTLNIEEPLHNFFESSIHKTLCEISVAKESCMSMDGFEPGNGDILETISLTEDQDGLCSVPSPVSRSVPTEANLNHPTLSMILGMNSVARVSMLKKHISMAEKASMLSQGDCMWLFALCAAVDSPLDADSSAAVRSLLRKCASLRAMKEESDEEVIMLNILATIAGKYFGQSET